jgi:hypothetical protein
LDEFLRLREGGVVVTLSSVLKESGEDQPGDEQEQEETKDKLRHGGGSAAFLKAAIVATAVHRHGGTVWVRSELLLEHLFPSHDVWRGHRDRDQQARAQPHRDVTFVATQR